MSDTAKCTIQVFYDAVKLSSDLAVTREEAEEALNNCANGGITRLLAVPTDRDITEQYIYIAPGFRFYTIFQKRDTASKGQQRLIQP